MKRLLLFLLFSPAMFAQSSGPVSISIPGPPLDNTVLIQSTISRDLGVTPQAGTYVLTFSVANRFGPYPGHYYAELDIGNKELCPIGGWGPYSFTIVTLVCPVSNYITLYSGFGFDPTQHLNLVLTENGPAYWGVQFNNVSLTFTPDQSANVVALSAKLIYDDGTPVAATVSIFNDSTNALVASKPLDASGRLSAALTLDPTQPYRVQAVDTVTNKQFPFVLRTLNVPAPIVRDIFTMLSTNEIDVTLAKADDSLKSYILATR